MNRGFSLRQGLHHPDHDKFVMSVEVELADSEAIATNGEELEVYIAVKIGEIIVVGEMGHGSTSRDYI